MMDRCLTDIPPLATIQDAHTSACWLPRGLVGLNDETDTTRAAATTRHGSIAVLAEATISAPEAAVLDADAAIVVCVTSGLVPSARTRVRVTS